MTDADTAGEMASPDDVPAIGDDEGVYQRDADGNLTPQTEVVEWGGEMRKFVHYPIPIGDLDEFQSMGADVAIEDLCEVLAEKVVSPNRTPGEWGDTEPAQFHAILDRLVEKATGETPTNDLHAEIQAELEERGDSGN